MLWSLRVVFFINAMAIALWLPRVADVRNALGLDYFTLSICLFAMPSGVMAGFLFAPRLIGRIGVKRSTIWSNAAMIAAYLLPALAFNAASLFLSLLLIGLIVSVIEVAMNTKANQTEATLGRKIMSATHGFWTLGTMAGALVSGTMARLGFSLLEQQMIVLAVLLAVSIGTGRFIADDGNADIEPEKGLSLPTLAILPICILPLGALMLEGAMIEWSPLFVREVLGTDTFTASLVYSVFAASMAAGRFTGDRIADKFSTRNVLLASAFLVSVGMLVFGMSTSTALAGLGGALVGIGAANVYPMAISLAANMPGRRAESNVAGVAFIGFFAFLISPPLIGSVADLFSLRASFLLIAPLGLIPFALIWGGFIRNA